MYLLNSHIKYNFSFLTIILVLFTVFLTATLANAATFTVTRTDDRNTTCDSGVDCSLREAIIAANRLETDDIIAFDAIVFASAQTITLGGTQLTVENNGSLVINGTQANMLTVSGNNLSRVFYIHGSNVTINNLTITNGNILFGSGGGILKDSGFDNLAVNSLIINNSIITGNLAGSNFMPGVGGGICTSGLGSTIISKSNISNNSASSGSGGIASSDSVTLSNSTVSGNKLLSTHTGAGGIINAGTMNITNSTVSGNTTGFGSGGGIYNSSALNITNSTISDNTATNDGGGIYNAVTGNIYLFNSTICNNKSGTSGTGEGGGVHNTSIASNYLVVVRNTIIADNLSRGKANDFDGNLQSEGYNLIETVNGNLHLFGTTTGNLLNIDPMLDPVLRNNGGQTLTRALLSGNPAINAGDNTDASVGDQREFPRIVGGTIDIGAFEYAAIVKSRKRVRLF